MKGSLAKPAYYVAVSLYSLLIILGIVGVDGVCDSAGSFFGTCHRMIAVIESCCFGGRSLTIRFVVFYILSCVMGIIDCVSELMNSKIIPLLPRP